MDAGSSADRSRAFYRRLGATGLAIRTTREWNDQILATLLAQLPASGRVLDVGCGYGRMAIPLAERGYDVTGVDVSPNLLRAARREATRRRVAVRFDHASMIALPYEAAAFDAEICLWSAFYELLEVGEQVVALGEMQRVLRTDGVAIIEGPEFVAPTDHDIRLGLRSGPDHRIVASIVGGQRMQQFAHDATSLRRVAAAAGIESPEVSIQRWAGRDRQILTWGRPHHRRPPLGRSIDEHEPIGTFEAGGADGGP